MPSIQTPHQTVIHYTGPDFRDGPLPALIYFSLSASTSLYVEPFNQPIQALSGLPLRTFSWDLPFHDDQTDPKKAMEKWATESVQHPQFIQDFIKLSKLNINFLIDQKIIDSTQISIAGLSRGAYAAIYLAAEDPRISHILGFAPLTQLRTDHPYFPYSIDPALTLLRHTDALISKTIRLYIGNHDMRVGTDLCFSFFNMVVKRAYEKGIHSPPMELIIYPSIGHKGHGTPHSIFQNGAEWIKKQLIKL